MDIKKSTQLYESAQAVIPGGVNSPVRACKAVGTTPLFIERAEGSQLFDTDGNAFIDYVGSWGPMILGHRPPAVVQAIVAELAKGTSFGAPTELEVELARMIIDAVTSVEMVRMVNSGTEATMSAIRLARAVTGRDTIVKFDGCYHGHADSLLVEAGSGVATLGIPGSPGIPAAFAELTLSLPYNDTAAVRDLMAKRGDQLAAVIVEPIAGNMGLVPPRGEFLGELRALTEKYGTVLIFDEVMTGFRVARGGAQALYGIAPDISCFGKIIGGGLPVGAYGGRAEIMKQVAPQGAVYQAGTLSGNPLAMAAGLATLKQLAQPGFYEALENLSKRLANGLQRAAGGCGLPISIARVGSMLGLFFTDREVHNFTDAKTSNLSTFATYYQRMLNQGIYLAPSQFEALFVSAAHTTEQIDRTVAAAETVFGQLKPTTQEPRSYQP